MNAWKGREHEREKQKEQDTVISDISLTIQHQATTELNDMLNIIRNKEAVTEPQKNE